MPPLILVSPYRVASRLAIPDIDPYLDYVTLLMHETNNTNSAINAMYADEKGATFTLSGTPPVAAGKFGDAVRVGNTGYMRSTTRPMANVGTGDFTFEFFVRINQLGAIGDHDYVNFDLNPIQIGMDTNHSLHFDKYGDPWNTCVSTSSLKTDGSWVHVAIARAAGVTYMFFDGTLVATSSKLSGVDISQTNDFFIGARNGGGVYTTNGNYDLDEIRVTVGVARYTQAFIAPSKQYNDNFIDPYWNYVTAMLPLSSDLKDTRGNAVTVVGNTTLSAAKVKFGTQAAYFDGNEDYLTLPSSVAQFGTGDFTLEAWINPESYINVNSSGSSNVISQYLGDSNLRWNFSVNASGVTFSIQPNNNSTTASTNPKVAPLNTWTHIAAVRKGGNVIVYVNGFAGPSVSIPTSFLLSSNVGIGCFINAVFPYHENFKGAIQDVRITKGIARYTQNFSVPTRPQTTQPFKIGMLMRMQGNAAIAPTVAAFVDEYSHTVSMNGNVTFANGAPTGTSAMFTGGSLAVSQGSTTDFVIGTSDYSISGYAYVDSHNGTYRTFASTGHMTDYCGFFVGLHTNNCLMALEGTGGTAWATPQQISPNVFPIKKWVKWELVRKAGVTILKMDDVEQLRWNSTFNLTNAGGYIAIGGRNYGNAWMQPLVGPGYLNNVRFYKY